MIKNLKYSKILVRRFSDNTSIKQPRKQEYCPFSVCPKRGFIMKFNTKRLALSGVVAALYVALTYAVLPIASGAIQFRLSEGLTLLPLLFPEAVVGVFVGCLISNLITGCAIWDIVFGSTITLVAGILTFYTGKLIKKTALKIFVGGLFPVLLNAFFLPVIWYFCYGELEFLYIIQVLFLLLGQSVSVYLIGTPLVIETDKRIIKKDKEENISEEINLNPEGEENELKNGENKNEEEN